LSIIQDDNFEIFLQNFNLILNKKIIKKIINYFMLKLRLKRNGRKRQPAYRLVIMESTTRRDGRPVDEVGYYNPITKESVFNEEKNYKMVKLWRSAHRNCFSIIKEK